MATALTPALLLATPAVAASSATTVATASDATTSNVDEMSDDDVRVAIMRIIADPSTGKAVYAAAQKAMDGTIEDQRYFLETGRWIAQFEDDMVATARILHIATQNGDKAVIREANKALDAATPEAVRAFLETGYRLAQFEDDRVATFRILHIGQENDYKAVVREATKALEVGTPEALRAFRETGYRLAQAEDDRVATFRILADPDISDALRAAAEAALEDGTPEALRHFIEVGQYEVDG
ncbi:ALF repeat-containing protein [Streptomyces ferrugineus]|uniref:ALF repeat-containing protein n=1 Tax=Streptomyces ferrugineus TaxID=1413221 RepID=UPI001D14725B|nr:ALF repeat-containing protein [Streptomyces ferrugineus]